MLAGSIHWNGVGVRSQDGCRSACAISTSFSGVPAFSQSQTSPLWGNPSSRSIAETMPRRRREAKTASGCASPCSSLSGMITTDGSSGRKRSRHATRRPPPGSSSLPSQSFAAGRRPSRPRRRRRGRRCRPPEVPETIEQPPDALDAPLHIRSALAKVLRIAEPHDVVGVGASSVLVAIACFDPMLERLPRIAARLFSASPRAFSQS